LFGDENMVAGIRCDAIQYIGPGRWFLHSCGAQGFKHFHKQNQETFSMPLKYPILEVAVVLYFNYPTKAVTEKPSPL
jgi:hypothetical protein